MDRNIEKRINENQSYLMHAVERSKQGNCDTLSALAHTGHNCQAKLVNAENQSVISQFEAKEAVMVEQVIGGQIVTAITTTVGAPVDVDREKFVPLIIKLAMSAARAEGFWSGDLEAPANPNDDWILIQRFKLEKDALAFSQSDDRKRIVEELKSIAGSSVVKEVTAVDKRADITSGIITEVKKGMEEAYFNWEYKVQCVQAKFPGYRGAYFQPPSAASRGQWATMLHFDKPESLEAWFESNERKELLEEQVQFVNSTQIKALQSAFPGWFPVDEAGDPPAVWKTGLLVLLGLFPTVMLEIKFLAPVLAGLNPAVANFISLVISVAVTSYWTTPVFIQWFTWWIFPKDKSSKVATDVKGTAILAALFLAEIAAMWTLLLK